jgi:hypothetical protein
MCAEGEMTVLLQFIKCKVVITCLDILLLKMFLANKARSSFGGGGI